jgi:hypothetical protein
LPLLPRLRPVANDGSLFGEAPVRRRAADSPMRSPGFARHLEPAKAGLTSGLPRVVAGLFASCDPDHKLVRAFERQMPCYAVE